METQELTLTIPTSLDDLTILDVVVFDEIMKEEGLSDAQRTTKLIAHLQGLSDEEVKLLPLDVFNQLANTVIPLFTETSENIDIKDRRIVVIDGQSYGLDPKLEAIETGAYIDLQELLTSEVISMDKIMAILYRPVTQEFGELYNVSTYSDEDDQLVAARAELFKHRMPYSVVRAVVNFTLKAIKN